MAKRDIKRNGYVKIRQKERLDLILDGMERKMIKKIKQQNPPNIGIKQKVIDTYKKTGNKEEAYKVVHSLNKKIGQEAFTIDMVDQWLKVCEESTIKSREEDDDAR